jgi:spermidine synthase
MAVRGWEIVESGPVPGSAGVMQLLRRGHELTIRVDNHELMSNRQHGSEDALAELAAARVGGRAGARVLIGGLGMGFTLAAALRSFGPDATVVVAELVPVIVAWNEGLVGEVAGRPLEDPRASVHVGDVAALIRQPPAPWDAILLDVDNGAAGLTRRSNDGLYDPAGLAAAWSALRPGGVLAVWSASEEPAFMRRLRAAGFAVEAVSVRSRGAKGGRRHVVVVAMR